MNAAKRSLSVIACLLLCCISTDAQLAFDPSDEGRIMAMHPKVHNFTTLTYEMPVAEQEELALRTDPAYHAHPEYGVETYRAQCEDCIELIHKRTFDSRYFIRPGTDEKVFFVQQIYGQLHYMDEQGWLRTIDERLKPAPAGQGRYEAPHQPVPTAFDGQTGETRLKVGPFELRHLGNMRLLVDDGQQMSPIALQQPGTYTVGDDGVRMIDFFDQINREQIFRQGEVKTNYILKSPLGLAAGAKWLVVEDRFTLPQGLSLSPDPSTGSYTPEGFWFGELVIRDAQGEEVFRMGRPTFNDANPDKFANSQSHVPGTTESGYDWDQNGQDITLRIRVNAEWISAPNRVYPITIDPLVTGSATYSSGTMGFRYDGSCWNAANYCAYNLNVNVPGMSEITNAYFNAQYLSVSWGCGIFNDCWMSEAAFRMYGPCDHSPGGALYWTCLAPVGNAPGTCTGAGNPAAGTVTCLAPQCPNYNLAFQMRNFYCYCSAAGCPTACQYMPNNSWTVTVEARRVEALAAANSTPVTYNGSCGVPVSIDATPDYGVPGYYYSWNQGPSPNSQSQSVTHNANGTYTYTVTVTDACGVTATTTVDVVINDCVLPLELISFEGREEGSFNLLSWETASEKDMRSFVVQRSEDGKVFQDAGMVNARNIEEGGTYSFTDVNPLPGTTWYRLKMTTFSGADNFSEVVEISRADDSELPKISRDGDMLEISWLGSEDGEGRILLLSLSGAKLKESLFYERAGDSMRIRMDVSDLPAGIYLIKWKGAAMRVPLVR